MIAMVFLLRRDLTRVDLTENGIKVGVRLIPYAEIARVDPKEGSMVFRLLLKGGSRAYLSRIGISSEREFFEELQRRIHL